MVGTSLRLAASDDISFGLSLATGGGEECNQHTTDDADGESRFHISWTE
jgi:hypothetical protein